MLNTLKNQSLYLQTQIREIKYDISKFTDYKTKNNDYIVNGYLIILKSIFILI